MKIRKYLEMLVATACLILLNGCYTIPPANNKHVTLTGKVFEPTEYMNKFDVYTTSDKEWLYVLTSTEVENGALMDLKPGMNIAYDAQYFAWITDSTGWKNFCYFADRIVILKTEKQIHSRPIQVKK